MKCSIEMDITRKIQGLGISPGRAIGEVWILRSTNASDFSASQHRVQDTQYEVLRLKKAVTMTEKNLAELEMKVRVEQGNEVAQIFASHRLMLQDDAFAGEAYRRIQASHLSAEQAMAQVGAETIAVFNEIEDEYLKERSADIKDILQQTLQNLAISRGETRPPSSFPPNGKYIIIAEELSPAQTVQLPKERVLGFILHQGGKTSHAAILARTYGIPAIVANTANWQEIENYAAVQLDGDTGCLESVSMEQYSSMMISEGDLAFGRDHEVVPAPDFLGLTLAANIGGPEDLVFAEKFQAQGIGLYRTEFLFMGAQLPTEEEQVEAYRTVIAACQPQLTVIRTLDIGGDKQAPALNLPQEQNPFLGVRAIRLCFQKPEIFMTQLRALWRAATAGPTAVMFPMIATLDELRLAKQYLYQAREEIIRAGQETGILQVGMMIEIPAAALLAGRFAEEVDFFSIGTNDLTQYTLAVDREAAALADLSQHCHPAVLTLIAQVAVAAHEHKIWVGICGEAGGDTLLTPFFTALGIDELSMSPGQLPQVRKKLSAIGFQEKVDQQLLVQKVLGCVTADEVKKTLGVL
ncbi:MAG TPA: phosphoenolpyruvate--protein phosphotransferase [Negativicutes bacterium]|nr:phosphoenolpyruvate--protein phosphotransferase [Negativicutes bacterium]